MPGYGNETLGFRPVLALRCTQLKVPNPTNETLLFFFKVDFTPPITASNARAAAAAEGDLEEVRRVRPELERARRDARQKSDLVQAAAKLSYIGQQVGRARHRFATGQRRDDSPQALHGHWTPHAFCHWASNPSRSNRAPSSETSVRQYALALAVICGLLFFVFWIFRLAFLANFLSRAVMAGFITGLYVVRYDAPVDPFTMADDLSAAPGVEYADFGTDDLASPPRVSVPATTALAVAAATMLTVTPAHAADKKPNILFIMGDDIGMWNIGAYHRGMMAGRTPNLDKIAAVTADMLDEGSGALSALDIEDALSSMGAQLETEVGSDATVLSLLTLPRFADQALPVESAIEGTLADDPE